jgi:asparagine synthase (glutamine-hydrolysing)
MCGIAGFLNGPSPGPAAQLERWAQAMGDALEHRGPDDHGIWTNPEAGVGLSHRRLSIVDLSPAGHQPMTSANGRFVLIYNGEVYNHQELRPELEARGVTFRGHSDTEVILEAFGAYGIEATAKRLIGMFALAVWDRKERMLTLVRDRLGIKPLYWAKFGDLFLFGSELKALRAHPGWAPRIDRAALSAYMRHNYVPAPHSIYEGVRKLEQGTILTLPFGGEPVIERFWDARAVAKAGLADQLTDDDASLTDQLEGLLLDAVKRRMVADVPVGAFLSGGVDSSTVAALMKASNAGPVQTYSIGFEQEGYNEAAHAAAVAKHLGTQHTEMMVTSREALDVIPRLPDYYDEPFADSSQIPTYLVSALTRQHVTVALSGDGGDELFAGYTRYQYAEKLALLAFLPRPLRYAMARLIKTQPADRWTQILSIIPKRLRPSQPGDKMHKLASVLTVESETDLYRRLVTHWEPDTVMRDAREAKGVMWDAHVDRDFPSLLDRMQYLDLVTYLPDDILTKVDRASMAVALEARVPLIDHRVVEFAWRLPQRVKVRNGVSKWLLRQVLYRHVPASLIERPKMGFAVPLADWLRGPLRDWAETLLSEQRLREGGFFEPAIIRRLWDDHTSGRANTQYLLWDVLMFEAWRERWGAGVA